MLPLRVCHVSLTLKTGGLERIFADLARHHRTWPSLRRNSSPSAKWDASPKLSVQAGWSHRTSVAAGGTPRPGFADATVVPRAKNSISCILIILIRIFMQALPHRLGWRSDRREYETWPAGRSRLEVWRTQFRWVSYLVDRIVAVSNDAANLCIEADGICTGKRCGRIWNGIDLSEFTYHVVPRRRPLHFGGADFRRKRISRP